MNTPTRIASYLFAACLILPTSVRADAVLEWNAILLTAVSGEPPPVQNRLAAIMHLAMFDAINSVSHEFDPYLDTAAAPPDTSVDAAAIAAAHRVLRHHFTQRATELDAARATALAAIPAGPGKTAGIAIGERAARAMIAARDNDGSSASISHVPISSHPGAWQLTPGCPTSGGVFRHWREVTPFAIQDAAQFRLPPPPALTDARYTKAFNEVKALGSRDSRSRSPAQTNIARFYSGFSDVVLWSVIARQIATTQRTSLSDNARAFALISMTLSDAGVALVDTKYRYELWRPETAIHAGAVDGNPDTEADAGFVPLLRTPCHPSYPSGHATTSHAARAMVELLFGGDEHAITLSHPSLHGATIRYESLKAITDAIDDARVYAGIHFRFDQEGGAQQGHALAQYVYDHALRPKPDDRTGELEASRHRE